LKRDYVKWPNDTERKKNSAAFHQKYRLPNAVGIIDGTHIHLSQKPALDGEVYWTRKSRYSINAQIGDI
jgi:hypothetical protein